MVKSKFLLASVIVLALAASFTAVGYAYTSSTENSGNTVTSEYVVLTQTEYTFSTKNLALDIVSTDAGDAYRLVGGTTELIDIDGRKYYGFKIGEDTLQATIVYHNPSQSRSAPQYRMEAGSPISAISCLIGGTCWWSRRVMIIPSNTLTTTVRETVHGSIRPGRH